MKPTNWLVTFVILLIAPGVFGQTAADSTVVIEPGIFQLKKQPRFYLMVHGGYSIAMGSTFKFYPDDVSAISVKLIENNAPTKNISYTAAGKGLGEGVRFGAGLSYIVNDFINVGIDFDYLKTTISKNRDSSYYQVSKVEDIDYIYKERYTISYEAKLLTISPNVTFKAISRPRFFIYNKIGAVLTFRPNSIQHETNAMSTHMGWQGFFKDSASNVAKLYEWGIRNPAFGFMGAIGTQIKILERVRAFGEIQFTHVVFSVRNRVLTSYLVDKREMVRTLPVAEKEIVFEKNFTADEYNVNPNKPVTATRQRFPVSYIGIQAGLAYRF